MLVQRNPQLCGETVGCRFNLPRFGSSDPRTARNINLWYEWAANLTVLVALFRATAAVGHQLYLADHLIARLPENC